MLMWSMGRGELARGAHWMLLALMWAPQLSAAGGPQPHWVQVKSATCFWAREQEG